MRIRITGQSVSRSFGLSMLLISLLYKSGLADNQGFYYGCEYIVMNENQESIFDGSYGNPVQPLELNIAELINLTTLIDFLNIEDITLNFKIDTVDSFYNLFKSYKKRINNYIDFSSFFNVYYPKPSPTLPHVYMDQFLYTLTMTYEYQTEEVHNLRNHVYLATTAAGVNETIIARFENLTENPRWFEHQYVVGIVRFILSGSERSGSIIVDNQLGSRVSIVMDDNNNYLEDVTDYISDQARVTANGRFLIHTNPGGQRSVSFIGRPFCSPLETTTKNDLLFGKKEFTRRLSYISDNYQIASVYFEPQVNSQLQTFHLYIDTEPRPWINEISFSLANSLAEGFVPGSDHYFMVEHALLHNAMNEADTKYAGGLIEILNNARKIVENKDFLVALEDFKNQVINRRIELLGN